MVCCNLRAVNVFPFLCLPHRAADYSNFARGSKDRVLLGSFITKLPHYHYVKSIIKYFTAPLPLSVRNCFDVSSVHHRSASV